MLLESILSGKVFVAVLTRILCIKRVAMGGTVAKVLFNCVLGVEPMIAVIASVGHFESAG